MVHMVPPRRERATMGWWRFVLPLLAVLLAPAVGRAQEQCELAGVVLSKDGRPRANIPVDVLGPASVYTETDGSGKFAVRVRQGRYIVRVRDGGRRMELEKEVGPCNVAATRRLEFTCQLDW